MPGTGLSSSGGPILLLRAIRVAAALCVFLGFAVRAGEMGSGIATGVAHVIL